MNKTFRKIDVLISTFVINSFIAVSGLFLFFTSSIGTAIMEISPNIIKDYLFGRTRYCRK
jgi:hypothetical protein